MKKLVILFVTFVFMVSGFVSCSNLTEEENSSLTLTFNGSDFSGSSARNINISSDFSDYYLVVNVLGDYKETKKIPFSTVGDYSVTFDTIPVGSEIYIEANAYNPNVYEPVGADTPSILHTFTGDSSRQEIHEGDNDVKLQMKNLQTIKFSETKTIPSSPQYESTYQGIQLWSSFTLNFYSNGKYKVLDGNSKTISEGLYSGNPEVGNTIELKECIYRSISSVIEGQGGGVDLEFGNPVIVENPQSSSLYMGEDTYYIQFTNSLQINFVFKQQV